MNVAISPCPNDTWVFGAWVLGLVPSPQPCRFFWHDVQELNERAAAGSYDVVKVSAAAALQLSGRTILPCGGAFGLNHGPKLVARTPQLEKTARIAVPGLDTTAYRLLRAALGPSFEAIPTLFSAIPDLVRSGAVDAGLLIHETALLHERLGLHLLLDLGAWWQEYSSGLPLPLGVIVMQAHIPDTIQTAVVNTIRTSLQYARSHPQAVLPLVHSFAQELDAPTLAHHITAYANDYSLHMGPEGETALALLRQLGAP